MEIWHELAIALSLFLVIEGILPFLYPHRWRVLAVQLAKMSDRNLRFSGLLSILLGMVLLYLLR